MMVVLINSYIGVLNSYMAVPKLNPVPQSLEELAAMKQYRVTIMKSNYLANIFSVKKKSILLFEFILKLFL